MHWNPRRPKWPYLVALVCLFGLTLLAPASWQRSAALRNQLGLGGEEFAEEEPLSSAADARSAEEPPAAALEPMFPEPAPSLPPIDMTGGEPTISGPMVLADDYVAVDEPLVESSPSTDGAPAEAASSPVAEGFVLKPPTPASPLFTVESLTKVRDALAAIAERARQLQATATAPRAVQTTPRVMVDSADDRLAMIPPRPFGEPQPELAAPIEAAPAQPADEDSDESAEAQPTLAAIEPLLRHRPTALFAQLEELAAGPSGSHWAEVVLSRVKRLSEPDENAAQDAERIIAELGMLAERGFTDALNVADSADQSAWVRAARALDRRLPVWSLLLDRNYEPQPASSHFDLNTSDSLLRALSEIATITAGTQEGAAWREYLRIDDVAGLASVGGDQYIEARRATGRDVLVRMANPWLSADQREFLAEPPLAALAAALRAWASGEASLDTLAAFIERFESTGSQRDADAIAELRLRMKWSADARLQQLAEELNRHYRNANLRIAFSGELISRMIPPQEPVAAPVRSRIAGTDVRGRSRTETAIKVRLLPDATVWRFGLEAHGKVSSRTTSETWPARLRNSSQMDYEVRKLVLVNRFGLHAFPAEARADGNTRLLAVDSSFSAVPLLGGLVDSVAREQHRASRSIAVAQVKEKVSSQARQRMDAEADARLAKLRQRYREYVQEPLERFAITPEPVDMSTTAERAMMRLRLASEQRLAAHTPRPSAPSDSLASFQLHESVLNNAMRGLELDGKRLSAGELHTLLAQKIRRHAQAEPADLPKAAKVQFAAHDAVRVACRGDRVELMLNIVELRNGRDSIRGVGVHAFFRPVIDGLEVKLIRDGNLQFRGSHLRTGPRMVLHSVFGKLLPKDQEVPVLAAKLGDDPRFAGLMVTQLVIDDGWVALSLGPAMPNRTAWRTRGVATR